MEALDLHVEDGVGIQHYAAGLLGVDGKGLLVGLLDLGQTLQHGLVLGVGIQLLQLHGVGEIAVAGELPDQAVQTGVDLAEPAAVINAVGDILRCV